MEELNQLAAKVWQRVASGEAYVRPATKKPPQKPKENSLLPMLLVLLFVRCCRSGS